MDLAKGSDTEEDGAENGKKEGTGVRLDNIEGAAEDMNDSAVTDDNVDVDAGSDGNVGNDVAGTHPIPRSSPGTSDLKPPPSSAESLSYNIL